MELRFRFLYILMPLAVFALALLFAGKALSASIGDRDRGLKFAEQNCASCHSIQPNQNLSPLAAAPSFQAISEVAGMTELALRVFFQTPHKKMPNFIIAQEDQDDVIAYIQSLRSKQQQPGAKQ